MSGRPIKPSEVQEQKKKIIPGYVFDAVNKLIAKNYNDRRAHVYQHEIVKEIETNNHPLEIWMLDFEDIYRSEGWDVKYDKPAYCENYDAYFVFTVSLLLP